MFFVTECLVPIPKPYRVTAVLPVVLFVISLLAARWYAGAGSPLAMGLGVASAGAACGLVAWLIHTHTRSVRTLHHPDALS